MIVTCPNCSARYKVPETKITDRGAKITCPSCGHKFVVRKDDDAAPDATRPPADLARRDFQTVGIIWKVRNSLGLTYDIGALATLREHLAEGRANPADGLSWDHKFFTPIRDIADLDAHFWDVWQRAEQKEIASPKPEAGAEEDDSDLPTTIVGKGSNLADEIRKAVQEMTTPVPAPARPEPSPVESRSTDLDDGPSVDDAAPGALHEAHDPASVEPRATAAAPVAPPTPAPATAGPPAPATAANPPKPPSPAEPAPSGMNPMVLVGIGGVVLIVVLGIAAVLLGT